MRIDSLCIMGTVAVVTAGVVSSHASSVIAYERVATGQTSSTPLQASIVATLGGGDEMRDAYIFSDVRGLLLDSNGRVLVADYASNEIRVYDRDGGHLYTIGRTGAGPGDLNRPCCIAIASDGNLWVREHGNRRYSIFALSDSNARFVRSLPQLVVNTAGAVDRVTWSTSGGVVDVGDLSGGAYQRAVLRAQGSVFWDTIAPAPPESLSSKVIRRRLSDGSIGTSTYTQPFGPRPLRAFGPNGEIASAVSSSYSITWSDGNGKRIALLKRSLSGPQLSDRERASAVRTLESIARTTGTSVSSLPFDVPNRKPPVRAIGFDLNGRLWVERSVVDGQLREADLYDRQGRLFSSVRWPSNVRLDLWAIRDRTALGVATDSLGTISVVRMVFR